MNAKKAKNDKVICRSKVFKAVKLKGFCAKHYLKSPPPPHDEDDEGDDDDEDRKFKVFNISPATEEDAEMRRVGGEENGCSAYH